MPLCSGSVDANTVLLPTSLLRVQHDARARRQKWSLYAVVTYALYAWLGLSSLLHLPLKVGVCCVFVL